MKEKPAKDFGFYKDSLTAFFIKHGLLQKDEVIVRWEISPGYEKEGDFLSIYVEGETGESLKVCDFCSRSEIETGEKLLAITSLNDAEGLSICGDCKVLYGSQGERYNDSHSDTIREKGIAEREKGDIGI